jgi:hypothetical protein
MKNHSNSEKHFNFRNKYIFSSVNENNFYSLDLQTSHQKIINKKRNRDENKSTIIEKINKLESNQNLTNNKLDIILSILTSKLLGKNEFQISHYDLCLIPKNKKEKEKEEMEIKEDNDVNINDEFEEEHIYQINKKPHFNSNNLDRKNLINEIFDKSTNINNISSGNGNLKEMINDFLYQNQNEKTINENNTQNNEKNILENDIEHNNKNIENENINDEEKDKIKDEKNIKNNLIINPEKKSLDLNKYKFESDIVDKNDKDVVNDNIETIIDNGINNINEIINKENNNINSNFQKKQKEDLEEEKQISEKDKLENININEEINNKENNENNLITEESKKFENSQCDSVSVNSNSLNSSAKKSNKSSAKKIRGFNFRNKINIKKYNGNKSERSSSQNNSSDEK